MSGNRLPTTTCTPARVRLHQPTQRPIYLRGEWIDTAWGRCRVTGRLGERHADVMELIQVLADEHRPAGDGRLVDLLVDPAKVRRALSNRGYSLGGLKQLLDDLTAALVQLETADWSITGHLIDAWRRSKKTVQNPLGGERQLWVITLGDAYCQLLKLDMPLYYDPRPIARLQYGISQAVARHCLSHRHPPKGGWRLAGLLDVVSGGGLEGQDLRNARRRLKADATGLAAIGLLVDGQRVHRVLQPPGSVLQPPGSVLQPPGSVLQPPEPAGLLQ